MGSGEVLDFFAGSCALYGGVTGGCASSDASIGFKVVEGSHPGGGHQWSIKKF